MVVVSPPRGSYNRAVVAVSLLTLLSGWVIPAGAFNVAAARGHCTACHITPGGPFRYPVITSSSLDFLRLAVIIPAFSMSIIGLASLVEKWGYGGKKPHWNVTLAGIKHFIVYSLLQRRVVATYFGAIVHGSIYVGSLLSLAAGLIYLLEPSATRYPLGSSFTVFRLLLSIGGLLLLVGSLAALLRRIAYSPTQTIQSMSTEDLMVLLWLIIVTLTGALLDAGTALAHTANTIPWWDLWGHLFSRLLAGMSVPEFLTFYRSLQVTHLVLTALTLLMLVYTKLSHIIIGGIVGALFARPSHPSVPPSIPDIEDRIEKGEAIGVVRLIDTTWRQRVDYYSCVRCSRCHNVCPAVAVGRPLSPMLLINKLKNLIDKGVWREELIPVYVDPDTVWSCVTCGACVYSCPLLINHVETIIDLRRGLVSRGEHVPQELLQVSYNLMKTGNPYGADPLEKAAWLSKLIEKGLAEEAKEGEEYDYILWVGCAHSYDPRLRGVIEALLRILKKTGKRVAVIPNHPCCGEPARRIGDELMFVDLVRQNSDILSAFSFKKLLVACPHGYNVFKHEYPKFGVKVDVIHHTQLLAELLDGGLIKIRHRLRATVTYHDPCYLGRWNNIVREPRRLVENTVDRFIEMKRSGRKSFCCGGGGGGVFFDLKKGERLSKVRVEEASQIGAKVVAVACPFCNIMLSSEAPSYNIEVLDVAELVNYSLYGREHEDSSNPP
ncbi:MAG: iron-sulfur protein [Hyperthermus sp.]|nr:MAG: iron-sulfur protein [Hyperthermus sp.]